MYFHRLNDSGLNQIGLNQIAPSDVQAEAGAGTTRQLKVSYQYKLSYQTIETIARLVDIVLIIFATVFAAALYQSGGGQDAGIEVNLGVGVATSLMYVYLAGSRGFYRLSALLAPSQYFARICFTSATVSLFVATCLVLLNGRAGGMMAAAVYQIFLLGVARWTEGKVSRSLMAAGRVAGRRVVTIGEPAELLRLSKAGLFRYFGLSEVARVSLVAHRGSSSYGSSSYGSSSYGSSSYDLQADLDRALHEARDHGVEEFVVAISWSSKQLLETVRDRLRASPLPVRLLPDHTFRSGLGRRTLSTSWPSFTLELQSAPLTPTQRGIKRALDIGLAATAILLWSPVLALVSIIIKLDSAGPVIFRQRRSGFNRKQFVIFKFRTMTVLEDGLTIKQAREGDHRLTRVGKVLRRLSIDELPQLFNVLMGDMSLVGPRPHALAHDNEYQALIADYAFRHHVKPGMTGWAQVHGLRGETGCLDQMIERVKLDLWYIDQWSLCLDFTILARTTFAIIRNRAY